MSMYAVVKTGGKQVKLEKGMTEVVEKLDTPVGGTVTFTPIFVSDDGKALVGGDIAGVTVTAEIVEHFKGDKQIVFKFKKRKGYKRLKGHRQDQTRIRVTEINMAGEEAPKKAPAKKAAPKAEVAPAAAVEAPVEATVSTPAEKPAAKKPAARKPAAPKAEKAATAEKPAAKKPAARKPAAKKETPAEPAESE
jgi:large subunit ribosomal protein L21